MAWASLLAILRENAELIRQERDAPPVACPNDGEPLESGPDGTLHCPFDGFVYRG